MSLKDAHAFAFSLATTPMAAIVIFQATAPLGCGTPTLICVVSLR
ncbi:MULTISPECIES: hypothetical protein [Bradyrhizobium]|nr:hypothetical protein [Bradyrhizobium elkanii]